MTHPRQHSNNSTNAETNSTSITVQTEVKGGAKCDLTKKSVAILFPFAIGCTSFGLTIHSYENNHIGRSILCFGFTLFGFILSVLLYKHYQVEANCNCQQTSKNNNNDDDIEARSNQDTGVQEHGISNNAVSIASIADIHSELGLY